MSRYLRPGRPGASLVFTVTLADRRFDLLLRQVESLREAIWAVRAQRPFAIDACVVLPDHLHCVWTLPEGDANHSSRWRDIKARFTRSVGVTGPRSDSKVVKGEAGFWQRRFWEYHIRDAVDFEAHVRYCWINPVKHEFVPRAADWPFSSIHRDIREGRVEPEWSGVVPDGRFGE